MSFSLSHSCAPSLLRGSPTLSGMGLLHWEFCCPGTIRELPAEGSVGRAVNHLCFLLISRADRDQAASSEEAEPRWEELAVMYDQLTLQLMRFF